MITSISKVFKSEDFEAYTEGCGCCSSVIDVNDENKEELLKEIEDNISVAKEICEKLNVDFENFVMGVIRK